MNTPTDAQPVIYVVDDNPGMRDALARLFHTAGFEVETFESAAALLERGDLGRAGVLLLDVLMPGMTGLELQTLLLDRKVDTPIVFLTGAHSVPMAVQAMQRGAVDFIEKPFENEELVARVRQAAHRGRRSDDRSRRAVFADRANTLTPREHEVMKLVVEGKTSKEAALVLGVSPRTVEVHRMHVMDKMNAKSLAELVGMAIAIDSV